MPTSTADNSAASLSAASTARTQIATARLKIENNPGFASRNYEIALKCAELAAQLYASWPNSLAASGTPSSATVLATADSLFDLSVALTTS